MDRHTTSLLNRILAEIGALKAVMRDAPSDPVEKKLRPNEDTESARNQGNVAQPGPGGSERKSAPTIVQIYDPEEKKRDAREKWKLRLEVGAVVVAAVYAAIAARQWAEAKKANAITLQLFQRDRRAWIQVANSGPDPDLDAITQLTTPIVVSNEGRSPAKEVIVHCTMEIVKAVDPPSLSEVGGTTSTVAIFFPGTTREFDCTMYVPNGANIVPVTPAQREAFADGRAYIVTYGRAEYRDEFGPHWTRFCWWRGFGSKATPRRYNASSCVAYNDTDSY